VTSGITGQITADSTINIGGSHTVGLIASTTPITTIQANLGAGETATFYATNGPVTFAAGGNISLMGAQSIVVNGTITFIVSDLGKTPFWVPISQWNPPSIDQSFSLSSGTRTLTLTPGTERTADLILTSKNGFAGNIEFNCMVGSPEIGCSVDPELVSLDRGTAGNATLSITCAPQTSSKTKTRELQSSYVVLLSFGCAGALMIPLSRPKVNRQVGSLALVAALFVFVLGGAGCGAAAVGQGGSSTRHYYPIVTATSGTSSQTLIFSVTIQ